ncbi:cytochrome P450 [Sorangium sp. So ce1504]|uniref:cytochrome P450 n=1 Tax=Sorangium sp. So ce1504 TaxID=3133337 RepID=UPI003F5FDFC6
MTTAAPSPPARPVSEIPVAPSIPLLGSLPWMAIDAAGFLERVAIEKGPIARIPFGAAGMVMLTHPDDARYVLHDAARKYLRGDKSRETVQPVFGNGLAISDPPFWLRQRRIMQPSFSRARIARMTAAMNAVAERHLARLTDGQELHAHDLLLGITRDVIVETMFSQQLPSDIATLDGALAEIDRYIKIRMLLPFRVPLSWPLPFNVRIREATAAFDRVVYGIIDRREQGGERPGDLLDALLDARDEETGERMSRKELRDEVLHIFFAGHETTANALTWATVLFTLHPHEWERVRGEVDSVLGGRAPEAEDVPRLTRTAMVLRETLRLYPPAWMIVREAVEDDEIRGYAIPRGTSVLISPFAMHRHPSFWPEPRRFDPERFAGDPATTGAGKNWAYMPFGGGPHVCIGNHFGLTEMAIVLARLAQRGRLVALRPKEARPRGTTALGPSGRVPARFEARSAAGGH